MRKSRGFTLIEMMVAVAIVGVLLALAAGTWGAAGARGSMANAASDFFSALLNARQRAAERGSDVWVIIYPYTNRDGTSDPITKAGSYFLVEDSEDLHFQAYYSSTFSLPSNIRPPSTDGTLLEAVYLETYPRHNARFLQTAVPGAFKAPFAALTGSACSFCSGTPLRGAVVYSGDGTARFIDGDGKLVSQNTASLSISSMQQPLEKVFFTVTGPTGFVGQYVQ